MSKPEQVMRALCLGLATAVLLCAMTCGVTVHVNDTTYNIRVGK